MLVPSAPLLLSRRRDTVPGLELGPACAGRVGGERGSSGARGNYSPPRALMGRTLLPPIAGSGWDRNSGKGGEKVSLGACEKMGWLSRPAFTGAGVIKCPLPG